METTKNSVFVELYDMPFSDREDDRVGRVITSKTVSEDDLIDIATKRRTDINRSTFRATLDILKEVAIELIANGASVQFGLGFFSLEVKGLFTGDNMKWDSTRHSLKVRVTAGVELRRVIALVHAKVIGKAHSGTVINTVTDISSGEVNTRISQGGGLTISGRKLKIAGNSAGNGIRLINQADGSVWKIAQSAILVNMPKLISIIIPADLPAGDYRISITTQYAGSSTVRRDARTYTLESILIA